tara:strand:- start:639 stop:1175 length:537 start_codon:yes stop_codon:yes gene_type:complete
MDKLEFDNFEVNASDQNNDPQQDDDARPSGEQAIKFSSSVIAALERKAEEHNKTNSSKVKASQLKTVYRRGAQQAKDENKGLCAMARVNMFLRMKQEGKITYQNAKVEVQSELKELVFETKAMIRVNTFIDITENWLPVEADFAKATEDIKIFKLDYDFKNVDELYLDEYEELDIIWG